jgi:hypothetical protein
VNVYLYILHVFSPLPTKSEGTIGLHSVRLSLSGKSVFRTFLFMLSDIHLIFDTLLCHTKIQIKFEFGFDPLIFHQVT